MRLSVSLIVAAILAAIALPLSAGETCNLKIVTDATPDYTDMPSMIHSITSKWTTDKDKCWAMWYWNHLARRQTAPMNLHGLDCSDPIRQFNDYGYMMCSTIAGANCAIWHNMGYQVKYYDVYGHTIPEVQYDGAWHMYDDSMSAIFTLCDGKTIAGVNDLAKEGSCELSGGKKEKAHVARYHCLTATSINGYLSGADCPRQLEPYGNAFGRPAYRDYYNEWDWGHRYALNLRDGEVYTRYYKRLDGYDPKVLDDAKAYKADPMYYVPNQGLFDPKKEAKDQNLDPESVNNRFFIRGNGMWEYTPSLTAQGLKQVHAFDNIDYHQCGLSPAKAGQEASVTFRVQSANVTTGQMIQAEVWCQTAEDSVAISVSTDNGLHWKEVWKASAGGKGTADLKLCQEVSGAYEVLVKVTMLAKTDPTDALLNKINIRTITQINSKTQPQLALGKNAIYIGSGELTEMTVVWPDLQGEKYKDLVVDSQNIKTKPKHEGWNAVLFPADPSKEASLTYKLECPRDIVRVIFGGRIYNKEAEGSVQLLYSVDAGKTWKKAWELADNKKPWDVMQYSTVDMPKETRSVLLKYVLNKWGLYALRAQADYLPAEPAFKPIEVTFTWTERHGDEWGKGLVTRSHTQLVEKVPFRYTINVGGNDVPDTESLQINYKGVAPAAATQPVKYGYSDGKDVGGEKFVPKWVTYGKNLAQGKEYTTSVASVTDYGAAPAEKKFLTDGIVGPCFLWSWGAGQLWKPNANPAITIDLGSEQKFAAVGVNFLDMGDLLRGNLSAKTKIEVLTSNDGKEYTSAGLVNTLLRIKDLPINWIRPDDPNFGATSFYLVLPKPVSARYVQYKVTSGGFFCATELFVLDSYKAEAFDLKLALPDEK